MSGFISDQNNYVPSSEEDEVLDKIRKEHFEKSRHLQNAVRKSFIMNDQSIESERIKQEMDSDLKKYLSQIKKIEQEKLESSNSSIFSYKFWSFNISRNLDLFTTLLIDSNLLLIIYPLNTIKTRIQAQHKYEDVSYFLKNKVEKQPLYKGISQGYISNIIGIAATFTIAKLININLDNNETTKKWHNFSKTLFSLSFAELVASPLRLAFEVKKQTLQMNAKPLKLSEYFLKMRQSLMPSICRDVLFRVNYNIFFYLFLFHRYFAYKFSLLLSGKEEEHTAYNKIYYAKVTYNDQITGMILGTLISLAISNPFDVINTKIVTQQYPKYNGFIDCAKSIYREEGYKKLIFSGYGVRSTFCCIQAAVVFNLYNKIKDLMGDAFINE